MRCTVSVLLRGLQREEQMLRQGLCWVVGVWVACRISVDHVVGVVALSLGKADVLMLGAADVIDGGRRVGGRVEMACDAVVWIGWFGRW